MLKEFARHDPEIISLEYGISVKNPYVGGTLLLIFMHDTYGSRRVQSILMSEQPTFRKALQESLGDDLAAFTKKFRKWKRRKKI